MEGVGTQKEKLKNVAKTTHLNNSRPKWNKYESLHTKIRLKPKYCCGKQCFYKLDRRRAANETHPSPRN